ncbi:MAG: hypothetical protein EPN75_00775 [Beijerinckiaceae bacterium]|nr:MAG: hypothetical protein EPN75_00775 [Beijerinckiaceae bacterium]
MIGQNVDPRIEAAMTAERKRCIGRVLTFAALREQAAVDLDKASTSDSDEKPSEGAAERARMQADVARDIASFLAEESNLPLAPGTHRQE